MPGSEGWYAPGASNPGGLAEHRGKGRRHGDGEQARSSVLSFIFIFILKAMKPRNAIDMGFHVSKINRFQNPSVGGGHKAG